jgi:hypothetical protein
MPSGDGHGAQGGQAFSKRGDLRVSMPVAGVDPLDLVFFCLICKTVPIFAKAIFRPDEPWRISSRPPVAGKVRTYYYGLCKPCFELPDRDARCDQLMAQADGGSL